MGRWGPRAAGLLLGGLVVLSALGVLQGPGRVYAEDGWSGSRGGGQQRLWSAWARQAGQVYGYVKWHADVPAAGNCMLYWEHGGVLSDQTFHEAGEWMFPDHVITAGEVPTIVSAWLSCPQGFTVERSGFGFDPMDVPTPVPSATPVRSERPADCTLHINMTAHVRPGSVLDLCPEESWPDGTQVYARVSATQAGHKQYQVKLVSNTNGLVLDLGATGKAWWQDTTHSVEQVVETDASGIGTATGYLYRGSSPGSVAFGAYVWAVCVWSDGLYGAVNGWSCTTGDGVHGGYADTVLVELWRGPDSWYPLPSASPSGGGGSGGGGEWSGGGEWGACPSGEAPWSSSDPFGGCYVPLPLPSGSPPAGYQPPGQGEPGDCQKAPWSQECKAQLPYAPPSTCSFPGLTLDVGTYFSWVGCELVNVADAVTNGAKFVVNSVLDFLLPNVTKMLSALTGFLNTVKTKVPFSFVGEVTNTLTSAANAPAGAGVVTGAHFDTPAGGYDFVMPWSEVMGAMAPFRGVLAAIVWFGGALGVLAILDKLPGGR